MTERMLMFALSPYEEKSALRVTQRIDYSITGSVATPLPSGLRPTAVFGTMTGGLGPAPGIADAIRTAGRYVRSAAVIPATDEGNALVDGLLAKHSRGLAAKRPMERRVKK